MLILLLILSIQTLMGYAHTDWTGGPGYTGPWGPDNGFLEETNTEWAEAPGYLMLSAPTYRYTVTDSILGNDAAIVAADVNSDEMCDIFYGTSNPSEIGWYENLDGGLNWTGHVIASQGASHIDTEDINGDNYPDLLLANISDDALAWFENSGSSWIRHDLTPVQGMPMRLCGSDVNDDGKMDLISFSADGTVSWYENLDGMGTSWTYHLMYTFNPSQGLNWIEPAQLDSDASPEIIVVLHDAGDIRYLDYHDTGKGWETKTIINTFNFQWQCADAGYIDADDKLDVIASRITSYGVCITWFENGTWESDLLGQGGFGDAGYIRAIDLDDNNRSDVAATGIGDDIMIWMQAEEGGNDWYIRKGLEDCQGPGLGITGGDFDGDGILDLAGVSSSGSSGRMQWCDLTVDNYPLQGSLTTSIFMVPFGTALSYVVWGYMVWDAWQPANTELGFQVRASADYNDMGLWSDTIWTQDVYLDSLLPPDGIFVQCRTILRSMDSDVTPIIKWFCAEGWVPGGIEEGINPECVSLEIDANPTCCRPSFSITLPEAAEAKLTLYNIVGRVVASEDLGFLGAGTTSCLLQRQVPGIYFALLKAGNETSLLRFMIVSED